MQTYTIFLISKDKKTIKEDNDNRYSSYLLQTVFHSLLSLSRFLTTLRINLLDNILHSYCSSTPLLSHKNTTKEEEEKKTIWEYENTQTTLLPLSYILYVNKHHLLINSVCPTFQVMFQPSLITFSSVSPCGINLPYSIYQTFYKWHYDNLFIHRRHQRYCEKSLHRIEVNIFKTEVCKSLPHAL